MTAKIANIKNEIILYQPDNAIQLDVMVENETVWLTQSQMVLLFDSSKANISEHIRNIYDTHELDKISTVRKFRTIQKEGKREVMRNIDYFNLDMIIAIGYRVNTKRGTEFRIWATLALRRVLRRWAKCLSLCPDKIRPPACNKIKFDMLIKRTKMVRCAQLSGFQSKRFDFKDDGSSPSAERYGKLRYGERGSGRLGQKTVCV